MGTANLGKLRRLSKVWEVGGGRRRLSCRRTNLPQPPQPPPSSPVLSGRVDREPVSLLAYESMSSDSLVVRSEEHTSELQSLAYLVCRLLLEKKNHPTSKIIVESFAAAVAWRRWRSRVPWS